MVEITSVRLHRAFGDKVRATASVCFDGQLVVHDIRVVEGVNGLFVSMPSRKTGQGEYRDIAHPVTAEAREKIQAAVLKAFEVWAAERGTPMAAAAGE